MRHTNLILAFSAALIILASYYFDVGARFSVNELIVGFELYILPIVIGIFFVLFIVRMLKRK